MSIGNGPKSDMKSSHPGPGIYEISCMVYGTMIVVGLIICRYVHANLGTTFAIRTADFSSGKLLLIALLLTGILQVLSYFFEEAFDSYRMFREDLVRMFGPLTGIGAFFLAVSSAIGEEILFRGAIQPWAGLILTSIGFGMLHLGPEGRIASWSVWAFTAGMLLGWSTHVTGSILPAMIAHFLTNMISITRLRLQYQKAVRDLQEALGGPESPQTPASEAADQKST